MSYSRDPEAHLKGGIGAIAARDGARPRAALRRRAELARALAKRDRAFARTTFGPRGGLMSMGAVKTIGTGFQSAATPILGQNPSIDVGFTKGGLPTGPGKVPGGGTGPLGTGGGKAPLRGKTSLTADASFMPIAPTGPGPTGPKGGSITPTTKTPTVPGTNVSQPPLVTMPPPANCIDPLTGRFIPGCTPTTDSSGSSTTPAGTPSGTTTGGGGGGGSAGASSGGGGGAPTFDTPDTDLPEIPTTASGMTTGKKIALAAIGLGAAYFLFKKRSP